MYTVVIPASVRKEIAALDTVIRRRVLNAIGALADNPTPPGVIRLQGQSGYRARVGDYRILFTVHDDIIEVHVFRVAHRREVYER